MNQTKDGLKDGFNADDFSLNISIGSQKSKTESSSITTVAQGSTVKSGGNVNITATEKDINIKGSDISGEDVSFAAKGDVNITSAKNTNTSSSDSKASSGSIGVSINTSGISDINAGYSKYKGEVKENGTTHTNSTVTANDKLTVESGKDTNISGSKVSGGSVEMHAGGNLNIESQQDSQKYDEKYTSGGLNVNINYATGAGISGGVSSGTTKSDYNSVTDQSGIYAGEGGFDITVDKNTGLKGGIIDSDATPDKNKLTTGTLTWEDVENEAEYSSKDVGINVNINNGAKDNEKGVTPNIGMPAKGEDESTTKAGVAQGTIEITDKENQKQNIEDLNRDTKNTLNKLEQIFDKQTVAERKEMAALFGELAYNEIHRISERAGWDDGSPEKVALHAFVGGIMSELTGSGFLSGASGAAVNEFIQKQLSDAFKDNPDMHQWASALVGAVVSDVVTGNAQAGSSSAASGTKDNILSEEQKEKGEEKITDSATSPNNTGGILDAQKNLSDLDKKQQDELIVALQDPSFVAGLDAALEENPDLTEYNGIIIKGVDINGDIVDATKSNNREGIINRVNPTINSILNGASDAVIADALGIVEKNIEVIKDTSSAFQWKVVAKTGVKYVRKIPWVEGTTLVVTLNEASKNMSDAEFIEFAKKESVKTMASYGGGIVISTAIGGPIGTVVGVLAGPALEKITEKTYDGYFK